MRMNMLMRWHGTQRVQRQCLVWEVTTQKKNEQAVVCQPLTHTPLYHVWLIRWSWLSMSVPDERASIHGSINYTCSKRISGTLRLNDAPCTTFNHPMMVLNNWSSCSHDWTMLSMSDWWYWMLESWCSLYDVLYVQSVMFLFSNGVCPHLFHVVVLFWGAPKHTQQKTVQSDIGFSVMFAIGFLIVTKIDSTPCVLFLPIAN